MRKGFTLAELLIVLGITGVVAAILVPTVNNFMPDKNKVAYLKVHDELKENIKSIASNSSLYPVCLEENGQNVGCSEYPLINTTKPLVQKFEDAEGNTKLCKLLAFTMDANNTCRESSYTYSDSSFKNNLSFTTKNGMQWVISPQERSIGSRTATYQTDIYVDVDPSSKSKNCMFDAVRCKEPDRFKFLVAADGSVIPADPMGLMYLNTRKSFTKNKNQKFEEGQVAALLDNELREFQFRPCVETNQSSGEGNVEPPDDKENDNQNNNTGHEEEETPKLDPCKSIFSNPDMGILYVQCLYEVSKSKIIENHYVPTDTTVQELRNNLQLTYNRYFNYSISKPASEDVTIYYDMKDLRIKYGEKNASGKYIYNLHFVNNKYKNDVLTYTPPLEEIVYVDWEKPVGKCVIKQGTKECGEYVQLYDPLDSIPSRFDNNKLADDHTLAFRIADIRPRYDNTNIYLIKPVLSYTTIDAVDIAQWLKESAYTSEFGLNSELIP